MRREKDIEAFFTLVQAGLWINGNVNLNLDFDDVDWGELYRLAEEQSVLGLIVDGLETLCKNQRSMAGGKVKSDKNLIHNLKVPQSLLLQMIGEVQMIEQKNKAMNAFIAELVCKMHKADIYTLLVKGQGIAQCYEKPLWRVSGDIDLFLSDDNYQKAKTFLYPLSSGNKRERQYSKELGLNVRAWYVELHGTLRTGLSSRVDKAIDEVQRTVFNLNDREKGVRQRVWRNGETDVMLPGADEDVFFVFTHFIKHFYKEGGVSLRQLCDWCRLLWTYRDSLNHKRLESWIRKAGLLSEWKAFAALAVEYLGMPVKAMPLYSSDKKWKKKAEKIVSFILKGGEWRKIKDTIAVGKIFPLSTVRFLPGILLSVNWLKTKERLFNGA